MQTIGVVGAGQMGSGIAQVCATAGYTVIMSDVRAEFVERGLQTINASLSRLVSKGTLSAEQQTQAVERITGAVALDTLRDCAVVIEAATEDPAIKFDLFQRLDAICAPVAILASNT
jgi:3-hydroxybutyryl-CoA dehydrogenase